MSIGSSTRRINPGVAGGSEQAERYVRSDGDSVGSVGRSASCPRRSFAHMQYRTQGHGGSSHGPVTRWRRGTIGSCWHRSRTTASRTTERKTGPIRRMPGLACDLRSDEWTEGRGIVPGRPSRGLFYEGRLRNRTPPRPTAGERRTIPTVRIYLTSIIPRVRLRSGVSRR